uniref:Uncharacterized protein n=1 Tax=Oryza barthii TaxID=65489 RepID=A0A0D3EPK1_9ORYZ
MSCCTLGILVLPPTGMISSMSPFSSPASAMVFLNGAIVLANRSSLSSSNCALRLREVDAAVEQRLDLDAHLVLGAQRVLGALALPSQPVHRAAVAADVPAVLPLDEVDEVVHDALVEALAAEVPVAVGGEDVEEAVVGDERGDVQRLAAEVEHHDALAIALRVVQTVRHGGGDRLTDNAHYVEPGDAAGVADSPALRVVEVDRDGYHSRRDRSPEVRLRRLLHLREHGGGDLLGAEHPHVAVGRLNPDMRLPLHVHDGVRQPRHLPLHVVVAELLSEEPHEVMDYGAPRATRRLLLRGLADDEPPAAFGDPGWGQAVALVVGDDLDAALAVHGDAGVGRADVDAEHGVVR